MSDIVFLIDLIWAVDFEI